MVDLDQCTHATINGCDKEQQGWYPLPSSLSPSICLPSCPSRCPLPNCFSLTIAHLHLRWHPPGHRPCIGAGVPLMAGVPDVLSAASIHRPRPVPRENSELSFLSDLSRDHCFISSSLTHYNFSCSLFFLLRWFWVYLTCYSPTAVLTLLSHARRFLLLTVGALLGCAVYDADAVL